LAIWASLVRVVRLTPEVGVAVILLLLLPDDDRAVVVAAVAPGENLADCATLVRVRRVGEATTLAVESRNAAAVVDDTNSNERYKWRERRVSECIPNNIAHVHSSAGHS
jgi:hypothetical protein